jgi:hypothetical protein
VPEKTDHKVQGKETHLWHVMILKLFMTTGFRFGFMDGYIEKCWTKSALKHGQIIFPTFDYLHH